MASKAAVKPHVVFVFTKNRGPKSTRFGGFVTRLKKQGLLKNVDAKVVALEDLDFIIESPQLTRVIDRKSGEELFDKASLVYFKAWESMPEQAGAVARFLHVKGIPFYDDVVGDAGVSKLPQSITLWGAGVPVAPTYATTLLPPKSQIEQSIGKSPWIVKIAHGQKGKGNYLVKSYKEMEQYFDGESLQLIQPYVENKGDYRVLVYGNKVRGALLRTARKDSHLNNTSAGGEGVWINPKELDSNIVDIAERASIATNYQVAGVDVVVDAKNKKKVYVLEVNQGAQVVTGAQIDKKMAAFDEFLQESYQQRNPRKLQKRLRPVGRTVRLSMPELGLYDVLAKIDTGAYQSALHARKIEEFTKEDGVTWVRFEVNAAHDIYGIKHPITTEAEVMEKARVVSSNGRDENRYVVKIVVTISGKRYTTGVSLTDRTSMSLPMLLGRRFLRGRFVVNVELGSKGLGV